MAQWLTINTIMGKPRLASKGHFDARHHLNNRYRQIMVFDPDSTFKEPVYEGIAHKAAQHLEPGNYLFTWNDSIYPRNEINHA